MWLPGSKAIMTTFPSRAPVQRPRPTSPPSHLQGQPLPRATDSRAIRLACHTKRHQFLQMPDPMRHRFPFCLKGCQDIRATASNIMNASIYSETFQQVKFFHLEKKKKRHRKHLPGCQPPWGQCTLRLLSGLIPVHAELIKL